MTYLSRKLLPHERNYSTVEKEALAIKWAVTKLTYYLLGHQFVLMTDHAPLKWMATAKDTNARITRWFRAFVSLAAAIHFSGAWSVTRTNWCPRR